MIGIGIITMIGIGGVRGIQRRGQYLPLQVTIKGRRKELVVGGEGGGVFYYKNEEDECEYIMDKEAEEIDNLSLILLFLLLMYVFVIV